MVDEILRIDIRFVNECCLGEFFTYGGAISDYLRERAARSPAMALSFRTKMFEDGCNNEF